MRFEVNQVRVDLPLYSLLHVVNAKVRRAASSNESKAFYLFSDPELAKKALEALDDTSLRVVEHSDEQRLANFLEELESDHGLTHVIVDPDFTHDRQAWEAPSTEMISRLREV